MWRVVCVEGGRWEAVRAFGCGAVEGVWGQVSKDVRPLEGTPSLNCPQVAHSQVRRVGSACPARPTTAPPNRH